MSDSEDENFELYGTLLEPLDEDNIPTKKAFSIEDQVATDDQGRRRFHGAFTGGFSAGFFNTVGSLEGWKPSDFKSTRSEKANRRVQKPEDFMDDEDTGQFGIAPKKLKATNDYALLNNRKRIRSTGGQIPGDPVLYSVLEPAKETVGVRLLKCMGWKPGQGVGPRLTKSQKRKINKERHQNAGRVYGCELPKEVRRKIRSDSESSESESDLEISFAPDDYDMFICAPKNNTFGLGYTGLDKNLILGRASLSGTAEFHMQERNNKKVSIRGQAFGVGAFEEEDEDIYSHEDLTKYDFELESSSSSKPNRKPEREKFISNVVINGFIPAKTKPHAKPHYSLPILPKGFTAKHGQRISRFEPLPESHKFYNYDRTASTGRHDLTASDRSKIINSETAVIIADNNKQKQESEIVKSSSNLKTASVTEEENKKLLEKAKKITEGLTRTSCGNFKPFIADEAKQSRYEIYLTLVKHKQEEKLVDIQPPTMSDWEKQHERNEFEQASRLYKPTTGLIFDRFVSSSSSADDLDPLKSTTKSIYEHGTPEMQEAAKKNMYGPLTRVILPWNPHKLLCRRFNVPEPAACEDVSVKRRNKFNIFDYYEAYQQSKTEERPKSKEATAACSIHKEDIPDSNLLKEEVSKNDSISEINVREDCIVSLDSSVTFKTETKSTHDVPNKTFPCSKKNESFITDKDSNYEKLQKNTDNTEFKSKDLKKSETVVESKTNEETEQKPLDSAAKRDLFKAIFLSSSESESEEEKDKDEAKFIEMKKIVIEENINKKQETQLPSPKKGFFSDLDYSKQETPLSSSKKGFFSDLDLSKLNKAKIKLPEIESHKPTIELDNNLYGPKLPTTLTSSKSSSEWKPTFSKPNKVKCSENFQTTKEDDEWIEADSKPLKKDKHHKKHKKHKEKHKKHKSKHKKT